LHEHFCLLQAENDGFGTGDFLQVKFQVFEDQFEVADLADDLRFVLDGFFEVFEVFDVVDVLVGFVEVGLDEFDDIVAVHFGAGV
jgi:hypothetical protein